VAELEKNFPDRYAALKVPGEGPGGRTPRASDGKLSLSVSP
jgi:hypothetical protein